MPAPVEDDEALGLEGEAFEAGDTAPEIVGPQTIEEEQLLQALYKDLERGERAKAVLAEAQMRRVIEFNQSLEHRPIDGLGVLAARIPLDVFLAWTIREGPEFWHDPKNLDYFEKRANGVGNPGFRVQTKMKPTIVVAKSFGSGAAVTPDATPKGVNSGAGGASAPAPTAAAQGAKPKTH